MTRKNNLVLVMLLLVTACLCAGGNTARANDPPASAVVGSAVEQNGVRFEVVQMTPQIVVPDKSVNYDSHKPVTLFSLRVTNLTKTALRFFPSPMSVTLLGPTEKELFYDPITIDGYVHQLQESEFLLLQPGQSVTVPSASFLFWQHPHLCLALFPGIGDGHPWIYERLTASPYQIRVCCRMSTPTVPIYDDHTGKIIKTLDGFWTGDVTLPLLKLEIVKHL